MLRSLKEACGEKLDALDGKIGHVKDFYFDDRSWTVRYLVADTGSWLTSSLVLLSPYAFGDFYQVGKILVVNLTRKQIENSPLMETHKPVSRQYEEQYHRYYGWPDYWQGDGIWGVSNFPVLTVPPKILASETKIAHQPRLEGSDAHLRSAQAVTGYHLQASDGIAGHVCDFLMDEKSWTINQLVVKTGHRFTGKEVLIPKNKIDRISYEDSTVFVNLTKEEVEQSSIHQTAPLVAAIDRTRDILSI
jgi:hypothetical protein